MLRVVIPALVAAFAAFVAMVLLWLRRPVGLGMDAGRRDGSTPARSGPFIRTVIGGYVAFLGIVLLFHVWLAGEPGALRSALWGGAFLSAVAVGMFVCSRYLGEHRRRARQGSP